MVNRTEWMQQIAELRETQKQLRMLQSSFGEICEQKKQACKATYEKHFVEARSCLEKAPQILKPLLDKFSSTISKAEGQLCLNGKKVPPALFDFKTCFHVTEQAQRVFVSSAKEVLTKLSVLQMTQEGIGLLYRLASSHNTLMTFYQSANALTQTAWETEYRALCAERDAAAGKLSETADRIQKMERELQAYETEQETRKRELFFHHEFPYAESFGRELHIPVAYRTREGDIDHVLEWELEKENVLCVNIPPHAEKAAAVSQWIQSIVCRFLNGFPAGTARILFCDLCGDRAVRSFPSQLTGNEESVISRLIYDFGEKAQMFSTDLMDTVRTAEELITARTATYESIYDFNVENPETYSAPVLVVINGFTPDARLQKLAVDNMTNGVQTGVYFLVTQFESTQAHARSYEHRYSFRDVAGAVSLDASYESGALSFTYREEPYSVATLANAFDINRYSDLLTERISSGRSIIDLEGIVRGHKRDGTDFSKELRIPIGKQDNAGTKIFSLSSKDSSAHCVISGATGTGKSSLLQALVLGGAYHYSPEELEFYLIDMKDGATFYKKDGYDYSKLKHVRMMATDCKIKDLREFIHLIKEKSTTGGSANDIINYNKNRSGSDRRKRSIILIDEYALIEDEACIADLALIAAQGRAFGVSLILTSQNTSGSFSKVLEKISNSVEFKNIRLGELIDRDGKCRVSKNDAIYLSEQKGNCLGRDDMKLSRFRVAFTPNQNEFIEEINARYASYQTESTVIIGDEKRIWKSFGEEPASAVTADSSDDAIGAVIGRGLFGTDVPCALAGKMGSLLLFGDEKRAQSIEYSFMAAYDRQRPLYDREKIFFMNFGNNRISDGLADACRTYTEIAAEPLELVRSVRALYSIYQERKREQISHKNKEQNVEPILAILHDCAQYRFWLLEGQKEEQRRGGGTREATPMPKREETAAAMSQRPEDIGTVKVAPMKRLPGSFLQSMPVMPQAQVTTSDSTVKEENIRTEEVRMLCEMVMSGAKYGIYFLVHVSSDDINTRVTRIFDDPFHFLFMEAIIIPDAEAESKREKVKLLSMLNLLGKEKQKAGVERSGELTEQELYRCYYILGDDYTQVIPYEWR